MRISDWSSDVCSSDLSRRPRRLAVNIECPHMSRGRERGFATRLRIRAARTAERTDEKAMAEEQMNFQAEVSRLLDIVAHSLYSEKEIFLRELVSNAADACDRLRHAALTQSGLLGDDRDFRIRLKTDAAAKPTTVTHHGLGLNRQALTHNPATTP